MIIMKTMVLVSIAVDTAIPRMSTGGITYPSKQRKHVEETEVMVEMGVMQELLDN